MKLISRVRLAAVRFLLPELLPKLPSPPRPSEVLSIVHTLISSPEFKNSYPEFSRGLIELLGSASKQVHAVYVHVMLHVSAGLAAYAQDEHAKLKIQAGFDAEDAKEARERQLLLRRRGNEAEDQYEAEDSRRDRERTLRSSEAYDANQLRNDEHAHQLGELERLGEIWKARAQLAEIKKAAQAAGVDVDQLGV